MFEATKFGFWQILAIRFWPNPPLIDCRFKSISGTDICNILPPSHIKSPTFSGDHLTARCRCQYGPNQHFSDSPCSRLLLHIQCICLPQQIKAHGPDEFDELKSKRSKNSPKWAKNSKTKIFKNPSKIQFWSYCKKPYLKINQKSKTFPIF